MTLLINILLGFYVFIALLMVLVILMQRPKSEGLGAAFGGGVTENLFGAQTTNVLTKITTWLATLFFLLTFGLSILYAHKGNTKSELRRELMKDLPPTAGTTSPTPSPSPSSTASASGTISATPATTLASPSGTPTDLTVGAVPPKNSSVAPLASPISAKKPTGSPEPTATLSIPPKKR